MQIDHESLFAEGSLINVQKSAIDQVLDYNELLSIASYVAYMSITVRTHLARAIYYHKDNDSTKQEIAEYFYISPRSI